MGDGSGNLTVGNFVHMDEKSELHRGKFFKWKKYQRCPNTNHQHSIA